MTEAVLTAVTVIVPSVLTLIGCMVNNNMQETKRDHAIEMKIAEINANYDKSTALIKQEIKELSDHVNKHNNLVERMYNVENLTVRLEDMVRDMRDDKK